MTLHDLFRPALSLGAMTCVAAALALPVAPSSAAPAPTARTAVAAPSSVQVATATSARRAPSRGERVAIAAANQVGDPYRYGAAGPSRFDCSGLTSYVYREAVGKTIPRTSSAQARAVRKISKRWARPGDLVFFTGSSGVYHVAVYAGDSTVWHAPGSGDHVRKARIWTSSVFYGRVPW